MRALRPGISERHACRVLQVARSALHRRTIRSPPSLQLAEELVTKLQALIQQYPTDGYRRLWARLWYREGLRVNRKTVDRALRLKRWLVHHRTRTLRHGRNGCRAVPRRVTSGGRWMGRIFRVGR